MKINVMAAASEDFVTEVQELFLPKADGLGTQLDPVPAVLFPALNSLSEDQAKAIAGGTHDTETIKSLFKPVVDGGTNYVVWSIYLDSEYLEDVITMEALYFEDFQVLGAWYMDGSQLDGHDVSPALLDFMPDVYDAETEEYVAATELRDINLLAGQSGRDYS